MGLACLIPVEDLKKFVLLSLTNIEIEEVVMQDIISELILVVKLKKLRA